MIGLHTFHSAGDRVTEQAIQTQITQCQSQTTKWIYDEATGLLLHKEYADGQGTDYRYSESGQIIQRLWARSADLARTAGPAVRRSDASANGKNTRLATTYTYDDQTGALREIAYPAIQDRCRFNT